ncbi:mRNA capping enzyme-domain-containing protein [Blyttiomyces helicus]|uniref:mRNA cap guanine-N(7) methyltransferase n=1 Tax=Blyttiomyces helicus TaxID=388810 RepID=A0A4P9WHX5_9FUNG|nr:mRNA capping enzyme-domain-containing protein [Blyttiomyces helicus]|eukprot:RKO92354.1 mRNA capping enzyme-domain-containing protein [Blyttiomyces helicus]
MMAKCIHDLLCIINDSPVVPSLSEKHNVLLEYAVATEQYFDRNLRTPRFIGAQPETLHKCHIQKIWEDYSISEKFDGERNQLFISDNFEGYLLNRKMTLKSTGLKNIKHMGSILDVEVVNGDIFVFDILFCCGFDLRDNKEYHLEKRIQMINEVVQHCTVINDTKKNIFVKQHYFGSTNFDSLFAKWSIQQFPDNIKWDGFIFTPVKEPYPKRAKWINLLKWRPLELNSIDFCVQLSTRDSSCQTWNLFVGDNGNDIIPFEPCRKITILNSNPLAFRIANEKTSKIVECIWDCTKKTFTPLKERFDKKHANFKTVAMDVWLSINDRVHLSDFQPKPLSGLQKFHNQVKSFVIDKGISLVRTAKTPKIEKWGDWENSSCGRLKVLDLACGRGGDLLKWGRVHENFSSVEYLGIDVNPNYLEEAESRATKISNGTKFNFYKSDLRIENIYFDSEPFDIVSCQFALHYFFEKKEYFDTFIHNVKRNLTKGGFFTASLFDGFRVLDMIEKGENKQDDFYIRPLFDIRMGIENIKKEFGVPISAVLKGNDQVILNTPTQEFLVFSDLFIRRMASHGFRLIDCERFTDLTHLLFWILEHIFISSLDNVLIPETEE